VKRVGIIKMWALGDIVMATPMLAALRATYPDVRVTWVVDEAHGEILRGHPGIDDLIVLHSGEWRRLLRKGNYPGWLKRSHELRGLMRERNLDAVVNCHPDKWWTAILCAAPARVGLYPSHHMPGTRRWYTHAIAFPRLPVHATRHYLLATQALGCPDASLRLTLGETPDEAEFLATFAGEQEIGPGEPIAVLAPFTTAENKCWEPERFAELADVMAAECGARIVLPHGGRDEAMARRIAEMARTPVVTAKTTLRQYVALLRRASVVVSGDTSAMHIAAALGTPYVALFGPTERAHLAPLHVVDGRGIALAKPLPCAPCHTTRCTNSVFRECMKLHMVADVAAAAGAFLGGAARQKEETYVASQRGG
jgi:lipopolysaccharide heptosyltransferase I